MSQEPRRRRRGDETRTLILDAAEQLLRSGSYRDLSIARLMETIGYRRTVFYRHFNSVPDLVVAVVARQAAASAPSADAFRAAAAEQLDLDAARELLRPTVAHWVANGPLIAALRDAAIADGVLGQVVAATAGHLEALVLAGLTERHADGALQTADLPDVARLLSGMSQGYLLQALGKAQTAPELVLDTLARGWVAIANAP
jgi:AcrR family transcriptional regulator